MQCTNNIVIIKLWCIKIAKLQTVTFAGIHDIRSGSGKMAEGTKTHLVLRREIQESLIFDHCTSLLAKQRASLLLD